MFFGEQETIVPANTKKLAICLILVNICSGFSKLGNTKNDPF